MGTHHVGMTIPPLPLLPIYKDTESGRMGTAKSTVPPWFLCDQLLDEG